MYVGSVFGSWVPWFGVSLSSKLDVTIYSARNSESERNPSCYAAVAVWAKPNNKAHLAILPRRFGRSPIRTNKETSK